MANVYLEFSPFTSGSNMSYPIKLPRQIYWNEFGKLKWEKITTYLHTILTESFRTDEP